MGVMRVCAIGLMTVMMLVAEQRAEARIGRQLVAGEVAFACRAVLGSVRKDYVIMQNDAAIDEGRVAPDSSVLIVLQNTAGADTTSASVVEARLRKDPRDQSFIDFVYHENPKLKPGEALRINTANPAKSELVVREAEGLSGEAQKQSFPLVCVTSKVSIRPAKKKKKQTVAPTQARVQSQDLPERQPARVKKSARKHKKSR